jgi:hypothetical protein
MGVVREYPTLSGRCRGTAVRRRTRLGSAASQQNQRYSGGDAAILIVPPRAWQPGADVNLPGQSTSSMVSVPTNVAAGRGKEAQRAMRCCGCSAGEAGPTRRAPARQRRTAHPRRLRSPERQGSERMHREGEGPLPRHPTARHGLPGRPDPILLGLELSEPGTAAARLGAFRQAQGHPGESSRTVHDDADDKGGHQTRPDSSASRTT